MGAFLRAEHEEVNNQTKNKEQRNFVPDRFHYKGNLLHVRSVEAIKKKKDKIKEIICT